MKERICFLLLLLSLQQATMGQQLLVLDPNTMIGIPGVAVFSSDQSQLLLTNEAGRLDFSAFSGSDTLIFQHPAYHADSLPASQVAKQQYKVYLLEKVIELNETRVRVNRWEQNKQEIPHQIVSIRKDDIGFQNPQTAADMLQKSGQVFVQKSQLGGGSPMIRGFAANSLLIVVDGVRMNNAIFRGGNLQNVISLDPLAIDEAEVIFGPGSVIYGSDALGGVMDFHTITPAYATNAKLQASGAALARFSSANQEKTGHLQLSLAGKRLSSFTSFSFNDFDDLRAGSRRPEADPDFGKRFNYALRSNGEDSLANNPDVNVQVPSGYKQLNLTQKLRFRLSNQAELQYGLLYSNTSDIPRYDRLILYGDNGLPVNAEWYYGPQKWMMHYLKAGLFKKTRWYDEAKLTLAFQQFEESRNDRRFGNSRLRSRTEKVNAYTLNLDADKVFNQQHQLFYGAELVMNEVNSTGIRRHLNTGEVTPTSTRYPDGGSDYRTAAIYLSHKWNFNPRFTLSSGVRYTQVGLDAVFTEDSFYNFPYDQIELNTGAFSGSAGIVFRPKPGWQWNLLLSSGFRAPNVDDVAKVFDSEPGNVVVPNANLGPEYSYNAELGVSRQLGDKLRAEGVVFYSWLQDAMVRRSFSFDGQDSIIYDGDLSRVQALVNAGRAYVIGFSARVSYQLMRGLGLQSSVTFTDGRDLEADAALRHAAPLFGSSGLTYSGRKVRAELILRYNGGIDFEDLAPSEQNKSHIYTQDGSLPWATLDLTASYHLSDHLLLSGGLENILDTFYWPYSSGIAAPGRNLFLSLRARF
ncbi:MAG: TonB-dependent receptor plug domain-containing protein [Cyclobacteriaceae bacterium]